MKRHLVFLLAIAVLLPIILVHPVAAQSDKTKCDPASIITKAAALKSSGDDKKDLETLLQLGVDIRAVNLNCSGMSWEAPDDGVIDPFDLPEGLYKATITSSDYVWVKITLLKGKCEAEGSAGDEIFNEYLKGAPAQNTMSSQGCRMAITIHSSGAWKMTIEPLQ